MPDSTSILFVHNLDTGVLQSLHDYSSGKAVMSKTDDCVLSQLTHSPVGMKKGWKQFLKDLKIPSRTIDRNEFITEFGNLQITFPVIVLKKGPDLSVLISTEELKMCRNLGDLIQLVEERISRI